MSLSDFPTNVCSSRLHLGASDLVYIERDSIFFRVASKIYVSFTGEQRSDYIRRCQRGFECSSAIEKLTVYAQHVQRCFLFYLGELRGEVDDALVVVHDVEIRVMCVEVPLRAFFVVHFGSVFVMCLFTSARNAICRFDAVVNRVFRRFPNLS